jgi:PTH1 family peptidyl-tRNA hydrolase
LRGPPPPRNGAEVGGPIMEGMSLIVGLGNPGVKYEQTRHNAGFMVVDLLARRWQARWKQEGRFCARLARAEVDGGKVILCQPQTFMNASGEAVRPLTDYYRVAHNRLLVVVDDADLPLGTVRMRPGGGVGGHHGLESITQYLGDTEYARTRLGIGRRPEAGREITDYVLGRFQPEEAAVWGQVLERAADQAACWLAEGCQPAMNRFNGTIEDPGKKDS